MGLRTKKDEFRTDLLEKDEFRTKSLKDSYGVKPKHYYTVYVIKFLKVSIFVSCPNFYRDVQTIVILGIFNKQIHCCSPLFCHVVRFQMGLGRWMLHLGVSIRVIVSCHLYIANHYIRHKN